MFSLPQVEKITKDATIVHFFLMFGYKLFSLYFPLFLVARNFSLPQVGYAYLLIYLPLALFAPFAGFLTHKINPAVLASIGIVGYGLYALGMLLIHEPALFYFWQILLGISAALFFVSMRAILISAHLENYDQAFAWFYTAPFYADALAPCLGALFIWKFDFPGVFLLSLILQFLTALFCFWQLKNQRVKPLDHYFNFPKFRENYLSVFQKLKKKEVFLSILVSFSVLLMSGFYFAFFILFLKEKFSWSNSQILIFVATLSFLFLPISLFLIKKLGKEKSQKNIFGGAMAAGTFSVLFAVFSPFLNFLTVLFIKIGQISGSLISNSGRSGLISRELENNPEEAGTIDTIFAPLGVALGALISGKLLEIFDYRLLFVFWGVFVVLTVFLGKKLASSLNLS